MIIYPQINNLRLIVVPFILVLCALGFYSFKSYNSVKEFETFLVEENNNLATELFDMIFAYHDVEVENEAILNRLTVSKEKISRVLDSIQTVRPSTQLLVAYRKQLKKLKEENKHILKLVEELNAENKFLKAQANYVGQELENSKAKITKIENKNSRLSRKNSGLKAQLEKAFKLKKVLEEPSKLVVNSIVIVPIKRVKSNNIIIATESARRTKKLKVCFAIQGNKAANKEGESYYIQIIDPNNNVLGDRGLVLIKGESSLINSKALTIYKHNSSENVCELIAPSNTYRFRAGKYFVSIFNEKGLLKKTSFVLN